MPPLPPKQKKPLKKKKPRGRPRKQPHPHPYEPGPQDFTVSRPSTRPLSESQRFAAAYKAFLLQSRFTAAVETPGVSADAVSAAFDEMRAGAAVFAAASADAAMSEVGEGEDVASNITEPPPPPSPPPRGPDRGVSMAAEVNEQLRAGRVRFEFNSATRRMHEDTRRAEEALVEMSRRSSRGAGNPMDLSSFLRASGTPRLRRPGTGVPSAEARAAAQAFVARQQSAAAAPAPTPAPPPPQVTEEGDDEVIVDEELTEATAVAATAPTGEAGTVDDPIDLTLDEMVEEALLGGDENETVNVDTAGGGFVKETPVDQPALGTDLRWSRASGSKRLRGSQFASGDVFKSGTDRDDSAAKSLRQSIPSRRPTVPEGDMIPRGKRTPRGRREEVTIPSGAQIPRGKRTPRGRAGAAPY